MNRPTIIAGLAGVLFVILAAYTAFGPAQDSAMAAFWLALGVVFGGGGATWASKR
jgi:hypothetical protein